MTTPTTMPLDTLQDSLRRWATTWPKTVQAAVTMLIDHDVWLRRNDFLERAVVYYPEDDLVGIRWKQARELLDDDVRGSSSEIAMLDLAISLGEDRYALNGLGPVHRGLIRQAVHIATNVD